MPTKTSYDVVVVGGGPAGLATAIAARQHGLTVAVIDVAHPPVDKACGEGILPAGVAALARLGVTTTTEESAPIAGIRFIDGNGRSAKARFEAGDGRGMRRPVLHSAVIDAAERAGAELHWDTRVESIRATSVMTSAGEFRGRFLVGADGMNSKVRREAGLDAGVLLSNRFAFRRHYRSEAWTRFVEVHWSDCGQMYVTPVSTSEIGLAFITADKDLRFDDALRHFPTLFEKFQILLPTTSTRGALTMTRRLRRVCSSRVALVGDASGSADAITGDGLSMSFLQAIALGDAMSSGSLHRYQAAHRRINRLPLLMGELMLTMSARPSFRDRVFRAFERNPQYFQRLLGVHTGTVSPLAFIAEDSLSLGWRLLTA